MESLLAWLAGAVAVGTAALFAPKNKQKSAPKADLSESKPEPAKTNTVVQMADKKAKQKAKPAVSTKKSGNKAPVRARSTKRQTAAKAPKAAKTKAPTAIRKTRKRKAS